MDGMERSFSSLYESWFDAEQRRDEAVEKELAERYRTAWETGTSYDRETVLHFIRRRPESGGYDLVVEGLRSTDPGVASTAAAVTGVLMYHGADLGPGLRDALEEFSDRFPDKDVLAWGPLRRLLERGDPGAKTGLLRYLQRHPEGIAVAMDLWNGRAALTEDELRAVEQVIKAHLDGLHARLRDPDENVRDEAIRSLGSFVRDGFAHQEEDADAVAGFATSASEISARLHAVDTLAALGTPRARRWLEELASSGQPREVAEHARRALRHGADET